MCFGTTLEVTSDRKLPPVATDNRTSSKLEVINQKSNEKINCLEDELFTFPNPSDPFSEQTVQETQTKKVED
jgi:hypothetical protein